MFAAREYQGLKFFCNVTNRCCLAREHKQSSRYLSVFLSHFPLQKLPDWHHKAGMESRGNPLKESRGER